MLLVRIVIAPDKFKGSLSAREVADALADGLTAEHPDWQIVRVPIADGGDGTVAAFVAAGWQPIALPVDGPTGELHQAHYAMAGETAVVELAAAVGLVALPDGRLDPLGASTFGLGEVIADALDHGANQVVIGLGGSASTDGGAGMLQALGARVLNGASEDVGRGGAALLDAATLDLSDLHPAVPGTDFVLACDVDNPLLGPHGATAVYGPQKGADEAQLAMLESALAHWAEVVRVATGTDASLTPGAGAAGGTGFGAMSVLAAGSQPGIDIVLELIDFSALVAGADLVVTGEGSIDEQTLHGKAPVGVRDAAAAVGAPVVVVAGRSLLSDERVRAEGFVECYTLAEREPDLARSMADAAELLRGVGRDIARR
ncbi:MAG TPA: glycerate kinase [Aldersonia sp.]